MGLCHNLEDNSRYENMKSKIVGTFVGINLRQHKTLQCFIATLRRLSHTNMVGLTEQISL